MATSTSKSNTWLSWNSSRLLLLFLFIKLLLHIWVNANYDFHRDEYLYLEQGRRLAWGSIGVRLADSRPLGWGSCWVIRLL